MSPADAAIEIICPHCEAQVSAGDTVCWLCQRKLQSVADQSAHRPIEAKPASAAANSAWTFNISSLLLVITLIAVCLGLFQIAPGLGIVAIVIATPALIRTVIFSQRRRARGEAPSIGVRILAFLGSIGIVLTISLGACAAFGAVCFGTAFIVCATAGIDGNAAELGFWIAIIGGAVIGLVTGGLLAWRLWPKLQ